MVRPRNPNDTFPDLANPISCPWCAVFPLLSGGSPRADVRCPTYALHALLPDEASVTSSFSGVAL